MGRGYHSALRQPQKDGNAGRSVLQMSQPNQTEELASLVGAAALTLSASCSSSRSPSPIPVATPSQAKTDSTSEILPGFALRIPELRTWLADGPVHPSGSGQLSGAFEGAKHRLQGPWVRALPSGKFGLNHP